MDTPALSVRRLGGSEWRTLRDLRRRAVDESPRSFLVHPDRERPDVDDDWRTYLRSGIWLVAETGGDVAGMLCVVVDPESGDRYVEAMWVAPDRRGLRVGARLLDAATAVARAAGREKLLLWVLDGNDRAREFYLRQGFSPTGRKQPLGCAPVRIEEEFQRPVNHRTRRREPLGTLTR